MPRELPDTENRKMRCAACGEWHDVEVVVEPGHERLKYCHREGIAY